VRRRDARTEGSISSRTTRTIRKDFSILTSLALLGLIALTALTGLGIYDAAEELLQIDDIHPLFGAAMTLVAGGRVLLQLRPLSRHARKRLDELTRGTPSTRWPDQRGEHVKIDYCPICRGVWLDRGELDVIIDRSLEQSAGTRGRHDESGDRGSGGKKKSSLFGDLLGGLGG